MLFDARIYLLEFKEMFKREYVYGYIYCDYFRTIKQLLIRLKYSPYFNRFESSPIDQTYHMIYRNNIIKNELKCLIIKISPSSKISKLELEYQNGRSIEKSSFGLNNEKERLDKIANIINNYISKLK